MFTPPPPPPQKKKKKNATSLLKIIWETQLYILSNDQNPLKIIKFVSFVSKYTLPLIYETITDMSFYCHIITFHFGLVFAFNYLTECFNYLTECFNYLTKCLLFDKEINVGMETTKSRLSTLRSLVSSWCVFTKLRNHIAVSPGQAISPRPGSFPQARPRKRVTMEILRTLTTTSSKYNINTANDFIRHSAVWFGIITEQRKQTSALTP